MCLQCVRLGQSSTVGDLPLCNDFRPRVGVNVGSCWLMVYWAERRVGWCGRGCFRGCAERSCDVRQAGGGDNNISGNEGVC